MTLFLVLQALVDVALIYLVVKMFLAPQRTSENPTLPDLGEWEKSLSRYRAQCDDSLKRLHQICDQASRILQQNKGTSTLHSKEESELREVADAKSASHKIPSLEQIENTRARLKKDIPIDLKTLLKDQLA